jgi:cytochrome c551/c552
MSRSELTAVLDFILNKADEAEFEVIRKACERRHRDGGAFASLGASSSTVMAKRMADNVQSMMGATLEGVRGTMRGLVEGIILKNQPDITDEQLEQLIDHVLPPEGAERREEAPSPLPADMLLSMARDFVSYSEGTMPPSRQKELWDWMPRWQDEYWKALPSNIKAIIKAYLEGKIDAETFTSALLSILGI